MIDTEHFFILKLLESSGRDVRTSRKQLFYILSFTIPINLHLIKSLHLRIKFSGLNKVSSLLNTLNQKKL